MPGTSASRPTPASVSAGIAAANVHVPEPTPPGPRFPGEDGGWSLAEMAHSDLDAALQLLVERAHYITGAAGAAIALRRGQHNDMLCRASTGLNAPELGALLSMEYGLSGECVRTRQPLRCDDAERDPRVNHEVCRQLGIASVVVIPIVSEEHVLGVFELLSGKPHAFEDRDLTALKRLSEMVETAVKYAVATPTVPALQEAAEAEPHPSADGIVAGTARLESAVSVTGPDFAPATPSLELSPRELEKAAPEEAKTEPAPAPRKPLFWSAAIQAQASAGRADEGARSVAVPAVLRNLQKCQACGFPVSQGRTFCVECEEKQWRGQRLPQSAAAPSAEASPTRELAQREVAIPVPAATITPKPLQTSAAIQSAAIAAQLATASPSHVPDLPTEARRSDRSAPFLSSAVAPETWFAAHKYILGAVLVVAIVVAAIAWLR
jgi:hypothetical protein